MKNRPIQHTIYASIGTALAMIVGGAAMAAPVTAASHAMPRPMFADATAAAANRDAPGSDLAQSRNAARSRMRECGHQWSAMKKNGSANGMTWKDFSQGCLAKQ